MRLTLILIVSCVFSNAIFAPNRHLRYLKSQLAAEAAQAEAEAQQAKQEALKAAMKPKPTKEDMIASQKSLRESKLKRDVKPNFDQAIKPQTSYHANGGIGIRSSQHFFPNPLDMDFVDGVDHLDECHDRRLANLVELYDHAKVDESGIHERFGINYNNAHTSETFTEGDWYVSYTHWRQKWDGMDNGSNGLCSAQNGSTQPSETQECDTPITEELDLTKESLRSNRIKMGLTAQIHDTRQSSLMSLAYGWLLSCELPVEKIEKNENEQIIESMLAKMAKKHNIDNYKRFTKVFGQQDFTNKFYTVNHASNHPISKMGGILKDILPKQKDLIEPSPDQTAFELFNFNFGAYPDTIVFNKMNILMPQQQKFWIQNNEKVNPILIDDILTSSPEVVIYLPPDKSYPMLLAPGDSVQITVVVIPETLALLQGAIHIIIGSKYVFMMPVTAFVQSNPYDIEPIYYTDVNVGEQVLGMIKMKSDSDFEILETYSTEDFVKLYWPNNIQVASPQENKSSKDFSKYMKIEACTKLKSIFKFIFYTDQAVDHRAIVHILTSKGDVLRIPIYFHIFTDLVKFTPSIVDFGTVPYQFDLLRVNVNVNLRNGFEIGNTIYLTEVLLPLNEKRLDFYMGKWDRETTGNIQVYNKLTGKLEEQRRAVIQMGKQVEVITVIMNPSHYGLIDTTLILVFKLEDGSEHILELPIIGNVLRQNAVLAEYQGSRPQKFEPWNIASPAITLNVAPFLTDAQQSSQLIKSKFVEERLIVENTFNTTLKGFEVVLPENAIFTFTYQSGSSSKQVGTSKNAVLNSGQSLQLGSIMMNLKDIKTTMGRMYFFLHTNQNMFVPMAVQISDSKLICSFEQDAYMPVIFVDCVSGVNIEFHDVLNNHDYHKTLNISNIGSDIIFFDSAMFDSQYLSFRVKSVDPPSPFTDRGPTSFKTASSYNGDSSSLHAWLLPKQTVTLEFTLKITQKLPDEKGRRAGEVKAKFNFQPASYEAFTVAFSFRQFNGDVKLSFSPARMQFEKTFLGKTALETMAVSVNSNLPESRPVILRSVSCADLKFKINVQKTRLTKNGEEFIQVVFDPNSIQAQTSYSVVVKDAQNKVVQRIQNSDITKIEAAHTFTPNKSIRELEAQDFKQFRHHQDNSPFAAKTIKTQLIIETDLLTQAVDLVGEIVPPKIIEESPIDFGQVQLGSFAYSPTTVISNPFNEQIIVQLFIGLDIFEEEQKRIADIARQKDQSNEERFLNSYPYTRSFCRRHLKGPGTSQPSVTPPSAVSSTMEEAKNNWMDEWNIRVMSMHTDPTSMCKSVLNTLMSPDYSPDKHKQLWEQVEYFFFDKILVDNVQLTNLKLPVNQPNYTTEDYRKADMQQSLDLIAWSFTQTESALDKDTNEEVDSEVVNDALQCSAQKQFLNRRNAQNTELTRQIAFPNPLDTWFPAKVTLKQWLNFLLTPFTWSKQSPKVDQTWVEWASQITSSATQSIFDAVQHSTFQKQSRYATRGARPEDFLVKRAKDPSLRPAMAVTNQYQLNNPGLHNSLLQYNGTVPNSVQSFYLNERYSQQIVIPAKSNITLTNLLIFEPPTLQTRPFAMNLYVKCDHLTISKVKITGEAVTGLFELSDVWKVTRLQNQTSTTAMTQVGDYSHNERKCQRDRFSESWQNMKICLGDEKERGYVEFVQHQVLGQSAIQHLIKVDIELRDVLMGIPDEQTFNQMLLQTAWDTIKQTFGEKPDSENPSPVMIADYMYGWFTFVNVGTSPIQLIKYGFEDSITGEISCESDGIFIQNCPQQSVETIQGNFEVFYKLKFDFTTTLLKRTLIFETMTHVQRFPVHFKIDEKALQLANQYNYLLANDYSITELVVEVVLFTCVIGGCMLKLLLIVIQLIYQKQPTTKQQQPEPQKELSLQSSALVLYLQTQDRFKMHNAQFMRESTNVIKKSNSAFADYQKNLGRLSQLVRKPAQVVTRLRIKPSLANQTQIEDDVLSINTPSTQSQHEFKDNYSNVLVTSENEEKYIEKLPLPVQMPVKMLIEKSLKSEVITTAMSRKERKALELKKKEKVDSPSEMVMIKPDFEESKKVEVAPVQEEQSEMTPLSRKHSNVSPQPQDFVTENQHLTPQKQMSQKLKDKIMASNIDSLLEDKVIEVEKVKCEEQVVVVLEIEDVVCEKVEVIEANQEHISTESEDEPINLQEQQQTSGKEELEPESRSVSVEEQEEEEEEQVPEPVRLQTTTRKVHQQYVAKESQGYLAAKNVVYKVVPSTSENVVPQKVPAPKFQKPTFSRYDPPQTTKYVTTSSSEKTVQPTRYQENASGPAASRRQIIDTRANEHQRSNIASDYAEQQWAKKPSPMIISNQQEQEYWRQKQFQQQVQTPPFQQQFVRSSTAAIRGRGGQEYVTSRQPQQLASQSYERKQVTSNKFQSDRVASYQQSLQNFRQQQPYSHYQDYGDYDPETTTAQHQSHQAYQLSQSREPQPPQVAPYQKRIPPQSISYQRGRHSQAQIVEDTYDPENIYDYDQEYGEEEGYSASQLTAHQPLLRESREQQYQHYQKRPYWQNEQPVMTPVHTKPALKPIQTKQEVVQPKAIVQSTNVPPKPVVKVQPINEMPQNQTTYWKPKEKQKKPPSPDQRTAQADQQQNPNDQEQEPVRKNNFYNAFKSIQTIFSQQKQADEDHSPQDARSKSRDHRSDFSSIFSSGNSLFANSKPLVPEEEQPRFSLFGDSVFDTSPANPDWSGNAQSQHFQQPAYRQQPQQQPSMFGDLQFKQLKPYNNAFADSLDVLTSKQIKGTQLSMQRRPQFRFEEEDEEDEEEEQKASAGYRLF